MLQSVIIDDDELSRAAIKKCIERSSDITLTKEFDSAVVALAEINNLDCDVIFLDVEMPEMSGMEFIAQAVAIPQVIIISSKSDYAAEAYNFDVTDYLVKPIEYSRFLKALNKANAISKDITNNNMNKDHLFFKKNNLHVRVDFTDIFYIEAYADYVIIQTTDQKFVVLSTMKAIEQRFPKNDFMRIHRSYIVRLDQIKSIEENSITIQDKVIPISRSYKSEFMKNVNIF